ncbi:DUF2471 family protein [Massilia dura]|uniref:DUF2471 family protein n=2 Tax=Pseudoduganella dura TaxID=321982 RepID=A0A6I3XBR3_9BURK|nr:DUF2471 family protein [Pseudoduganella dura]
MDEFELADQAVRAITQSVVLRYRTVGVLTWALLHQIEAEVLDEAARSGEHDQAVLNMMRAPAAMVYPRDDRPVSFTGHSFLPIVFSEVKDAWNRLH